MTTTLGPAFVLASRTDVTTDLTMLLSLRLVRTVWLDPEVLEVGLSFALPTLFILLCHEAGHWVAARHHGLAATLPVFLPLPIGLGTLGAFIRIRDRIPSRRILFDVGVAGPIAGFVALVPFLVLGVAWSEPALIDTAPPGTATQIALLRPGSSLLFDLLTRVAHGPLSDGTVLNMHPFALAAWVGLLVTGLNLLPLAQLDGGHILYAALGHRQHTAAPWLWALLVTAGLTLWPGWLLWAMITLVIGIRHPRVPDDRPLDRRRARLAWLALALLIGSLPPVPLSWIPVLS